MSFPEQEAEQAAGAHEGHGGTRFEPTDARAGIVIWSLGIIAGTLVFVFAITIGIQRFLYQVNPQGALPSPLAPTRLLPPEPQLQVHPWEELPRIRAHENQILSGYGRDAAGRQYIPIDRAMDAVVPRLNIRPGAPSGVTTPGGEGRDFRGSPNADRAPYRIEIKAGVPEHAQ